MSFLGILNKHRQLASSERDKGDRFERLMQAYLYTDPKYSYLKKVWLWSEFPFREQFGGQDIGIDLVVLSSDGEYWAVQCKCYQEDSRIDKQEVDSFLSTSGRSFKDTENKITHFSRRLWISTTNNWSTKANETLLNQNPPLTRVNLTDLIEAPVEWEKIEQGIFGEKARTAKKELRFHQKEALTKTLDYFKKQNRGKLIMACGTGKTFTSLRIAEQQAGQNGTILFLVPSIALLGQTLREWTADAREDINAVAICSDAEITKEKTKNQDVETWSTVDLAVPASTDVVKILKQFRIFELSNRSGLTVVFSTYQSIEVVARVQKELQANSSKYGAFDLIVCDEAHRTTGVTLSGSDESSFVKVHDNNFINAHKRLYMTATPRLYGEDSKRKALESSATISSMDDTALYGEEIYRIGFGEAVERDLLSDYKVLILTLSENDVTPEVQRALENSEHEVSTDDLSKLIGCINAMSKQILDDSIPGVNKRAPMGTPEPMRRAVAFTPNIKASRKITDTFNEIGDAYDESVPAAKKESLVQLRSKHIDGTMSATDRDSLMSWLKMEPDNSREARVLTNVRCLSEGVDVPSLDAVMFLSARNSQVDVVQSVGRVMRKSPGKEYGYIIIPIVIPTDVLPEDALNDNERYKVVWMVLNALRAHDDRFNAIVNKIDLNKKRPPQIIVGRPDPDGDGDPSNDTITPALQQTTMQFGALQTAIYAKMVQKVGDRRYWENWAKSVADIAERQIVRINKIVEDDEEAHLAFRRFLKGLQNNINPSITERQAVEMLSQHIITKPVFEALFDGYSFVQKNAVSVSMQQALDAIETKALEEIDIELLNGFYNSVRKRAEGIDNSKGKQRIIYELYERFFKTAFPKMVEQLGIVYTPIEVVDFIIHSVNDVLRKEFGKSLSDENVNILDPFTGTGTFVTRLLQTGVIKPDDLERKYKQEIFANEIVLLAYYIAAVNVENAYHDELEKDAYESFEGIVLTDTFQLHEDDDNTKLFSESLAENSYRLQRQKDSPIRVIIGNPPYSAGQKSANDNAQNQKYPKLDRRVEQTYAKESTAGLKNSLYDPYIKAFRWATDRLQDEGGVIGFVSNGSWIDGNAQDGMRKSLQKEFTSIYIFNLRGNQRTNGEASRREGGKIFGSGSRNMIAITILVKNPASSKEKADIHYYDIGDYLSKEEKLEIITEYQSVTNTSMKWELLSPNEHGDWINERNAEFDNLIALADKTHKEEAFFSLSSWGLKTNRDAWAVNSSAVELSSNIDRMMKFYNSQVDTYMGNKNTIGQVRAEMAIDNNPKNISWTRSLRKDLTRNKKYYLDKSSMTSCLYRPFFKQMLYYDKSMIEEMGQMKKLFPDSSVTNLVICTSGKGASKDFTCIITNHIPTLDTVEKAQCFPMYVYEKNENHTSTLFDTSSEGAYVRHDGISDVIYKRITTHFLDNSITKEDIFYYVYGILHSPDYRKKFTNDLKKLLARIPFVENKDEFNQFSEAGRKLAELHLNYEKIPAYPNVIISGVEKKQFEVDKLKFVKRDQKDKIIYNSAITIANIPDRAYEYVVNGRSAIEWMMDRYQVRTDKDSGIINDPNTWSNETENPRYILDLLLSVINVSILSVDIIESLPELSF